ncbi:hypothetical protein BC940DRAFT_313198 [Gongronella butleri]|nr:hypothetical protein BC940DRAFT_313198 [Gongronella butleri]
MPSSAKPASLSLDTSRISRTLSWLPSPNRSASPASTTPSTKRKSLFQVFRSSTSSIESDQPTTDEDEDDHTPATPRDHREMTLTPPPVAASTPSLHCIASHLQEAPNRATLIEPASYTSISSSTRLSTASPPPPPPKHLQPLPQPPRSLRLQRQVLPFLADAFDQIDADIDDEWAEHRFQLQQALRIPAAHQFQ